MNRSYVRLSHYPTMRTRMILIVSNTFFNLMLRSFRLKRKEIESRRILVILKSILISLGSVEPDLHSVSGKQKEVKELLFTS